MTGYHRHPHLVHISGPTSTGGSFCQCYEYDEYILIVHWNCYCSSGVCRLVRNLQGEIVGFVPLHLEQHLRHSNTRTLENRLLWK